MENAYSVVPVAQVVGGRREPTDDFWGGTRAIIRIDRPIGGTAVLDA